MCNILLNHRKRYRKAPTGRCPSLSELTLLQQIAHIFSYLGHISIPKDRCHWFGSQQNHQPFACPPPALLDSGRLGTELGEFQFKLKYRLVASQKTGLATPSPPLQDSTIHPYRHPVPRQSSAAAVVNPTSQLATMWPVQERPVSPSLDLQRSSIWPMLVPTALASARNRGAKLIPGRNTPSPRPAQRGARNDEESKIHGEFLSETVWGRDRGYRLGPYFHADVPQPGIEYEHSPTGRIYRCPGQRESEIIRSLSPPPNHIISLSQCHAYDHAVIVSHHVTAEHRAQALNESKALPPTSHRLPQSAPNETVPLTTLHRGRVSKTEYNNLNPSLRILICILGKMMKDTPMHRIVNRTTMRHLVAILSLKEYTQIPEQVSNNHDKANLLEFATYIWIKGSLRRTRLQDADRRIRCLISRLGAAVTIIPDVLCVHCREVTQERETFASGAYADVFRGTYRDKQVAVRRPRRRGLSEDQCREVLIWSTLAHKNILPFIGAYTSSDGYLITISPLMENGTLLSWRKKSGPSTREIEQHASNHRSCFQVVADC
ncbi:hypothetical protein APHAL10511_000258 [Amanita phalloides]|nr:hypothetical protein APHAL10511_000258 [Amanita phalloides]